MSSLIWWQSAVFYQIYPRSFADGNGNGVGDLKGILEKIDYLSELGIDAIWLSPHFPSPQFDCGYDISDYTGVEPEYGSLADFKALLDEIHRRGMRLILDLVLNHTSDQHPWFIESKSSRDNPKRDWYIWRDGRDGGPPNNWAAAFDECAWTYDEATGQWYYHFFFAEQPDLNWRNPEVKNALWDAVRFWLDMGVDGFRLDAIGTIFEAPALPDHSAEMDTLEQFRDYIQAIAAGKSVEQARAKLLKQREKLTELQVDQPGIHELLQELRSIVNEYDERVLVGEVDEIAYYGDGSNELHMVFNFPLMRPGKLNPSLIRRNQAERLGALPPAAWPCNTLNNHDASRVYSHVGDGLNDEALARLALALMLTLKGTPFLYNGEEIGMQDLRLEDIEQFRDNMGVWIYHKATQDLGVPQEQALRFAQTITRDRCRTPMQWTGAANAGFSPPGVQTWLPVHPNYTQGVNVEAQRGDPGSMLSFYQRILRVRKENPALQTGEYRALHTDALAYFAFLRTSPAQRLLVVLSYADKAQKVSFSELAAEAGLVFSSAKRNGPLDLSALELSPFEILIAELDGQPG
jgi:alpha-glucosidase